MDENQTDYSIEWSPNWICPVCGVELDQLFLATEEGCEETMQACADCGWESDIATDC